MSNNNHIKGAQYEPRVSSSVQGSFGYGSNQNVAVTAVSVASTALGSDLILLVLNEFTYVEINGAATTSSMMLPPGTNAIMVTKADTLNFLRVSTDSIASIITPA